MLEEMEEDYSGFFQGVKEILKAAGKSFKGLKERLQSLLRFQRNMKQH